MISERVDATTIEITLSLRANIDDDNKNVGYWRLMTTDHNNLNDKMLELFSLMYLFSLRSVKLRLNVAIKVFAKKGWSSSKCVGFFLVGYHKMVLLFYTWVPVLCIADNNNCTLTWCCFIIVKEWSVTGIRTEPVTTLLGQQCVQHTSAIPSQVDSTIDRKTSILRTMTINEAAVLISLNPQVIRKE